MPTQPLETLLWREMSRVEADPVVGLASPLLTELVNHATCAFARCASETAGQVDIHVAVLALYWQVITFTDAIEVLVSEACAVGVVPALRTTFEALLYIEYITSDDTQYVNRSLAWLANHVRERLKYWERLDATTQAGKEFRRRMKRDSVGKGVSLPKSTTAVAKQKKANLQAWLRRAHVQPVVAELTRLGWPNWYQAFGGRSNLCDLADYLGRGGLYDFLYRGWSKLVHAQDAIPMMDETTKGEQAIHRIRDPEQLAWPAFLAATFMLEATRQVLRHRRPGEERALASWYAQEIRGPYQSLRQLTGQMPV